MILYRWAREVSRGVSWSPPSNRRRACCSDLQYLRWEMAPSSKSGKDEDKQKPQKKHKDHIVKLLTRGRVGPRRLNIAPKERPANAWGLPRRSLAFSSVGVLVANATKHETDSTTLTALFGIFSLLCCRNQTFYSNNIAMLASNDHSRAYYNRETYRLALAKPIDLHYKANRRTRQIWQLSIHWWCRSKCSTTLLNTQTLYSVCRNYQHFISVKIGR